MPAPRIDQREQVEVGVVAHEDRGAAGRAPELVEVADPDVGLAHHRIRERPGGVRTVDQDQGTVPPGEPGDLRRGELPRGRGGHLVDDHQICLMAAEVIGEDLQDVIVGGVQRDSERGEGSAGLAGDALGAHRHGAVAVVRDDHVHRRALGDGAEHHRDSCTRVRDQHQVLRGGGQAFCHVRT